MDTVDKIAKTTKMLNKNIGTQFAFTPARTHGNYLSTVATVDNYGQHHIKLNLE